MPTNTLAIAAERDPIGLLETNRVPEIVSTWFRIRRLLVHRNRLLLTPETLNLPNELPSASALPLPARE